MLGVLFSLRSHGQCRGSVVKQLLPGERRANRRAIVDLALSARQPWEAWTGCGVRSVFLDVVEALKKREAALLSLEEKLDTSSAADELVFHVFGALAQFERRLVTERTRDGMNAAEGSRPGRPPLNPEKLEAALLLVKGGMSPTKAARLLTALNRELT